MTFGKVRMVGPRKLISVVCTAAMLTIGLFAIDSDLTAREFEWRDGYSEAMDAARLNGRMMLICFDEPNNDAIASLIEESFVSDGELEESKDRYEFVRLSTDSVITSDGETKALLDFPSFVEMKNSKGISIVDFRDEQLPTYGHVITVFPETASRRVNLETLRFVSRLPEGTLTQRTLVLAVMSHRERPRSVDAEWHPILADETESHSNHQARITNQGHHNWNTRFHRINRLVGGNLRAQEVCAESWPGQSLVDAAEECVDSWRQSSGHWSAVSSVQTYFSYDLKRGSNGVWYATGIFCR